MELSIVSTIYNDANTVELLVNEFVKVLKPLNIEFEIINVISTVSVHVTLRVFLYEKCCKFVVVE